MAGIEQLPTGPPVLIEACRLHVRTFIPTQTEPFHGFENATRHFFTGPFDVRVLNAKNENAVVLARKEPVKECSPCASDV